MPAGASKRAIADCEDRPGDKSARKVVLTILVKPVMLQDGAVTDVNAECEVSSMMPKYISKPVECRAGVVLATTYLTPQVSDL